MNAIPQGRIDAMGFFESHIAQWITNAESIGSNPAEIAQLADKIAATRAAFDQQQQAHNAALAATGTFNLLLDQLREAGAIIVKRIRTTAASDGDEVYSLASIAAPLKPSPLAPPGRPYQFDARIEGDGSITLTWRCRNPRNASGTIYQIERQAGRSGPFAIVGTAGAKKFTDRTIPVGTSFLVYRITAIRSTSIGAPGEFNLSFAGPKNQPASPVVQLAGQRRLRSAA